MPPDERNGTINTIRSSNAENNKEENSFMNKTEMTAALAAKTGLTKKDAEQALTAVIDVITEALVAGEKVQMVGFGAFEVKARPERTAHNPQTGEAITIAASKAPVFKAGKALKDAVNK